MKPFVFSVIGFDPDGNGYANVYGTIQAECQEYARRAAIGGFRSLNPTKLISSCGVMPIEFAAGKEISFKAKRDAYMKDHWPNAVNSDVAPQKKTGAALERGWRAGKDIEIRPGVKEGQRNPQLAMLDFQDGVMSGRLLGNGK